MNTTPTFFSVAKQPKWIGALLLSLAVAAVFALFAQWQFDRSFTKDSRGGLVAVNVESETIRIDTKNVYIVANRLQDSGNGPERGYWLIANSINAAGKNLTIGFGWSADLAEVEGERTALIESDLAEFETKLDGVFIPTEAPLPQKHGYIFDSLSLAQLVNIYSPEQPIEVEPQIFVLNGYSEASAWPPLKPIKVTYAEQQTINWLSAFYFLEWLLFAGFSVFLWWRLVKDEQNRQSGETIN